jgi:hypothetical protein
MDLQIDGLQNLADGDATFTVEIEKPDGTPLRSSQGVRVTITIKGPDSDAHRAATRASINKRLANQRRKPTAEQLEQDTLDIFAAITVSWEGLESGGEPVPCNRKNARTLYENYAFIKEQIDDALSNRVNFTKSS